ncbi:hypothetical protein ACIBL3_00730 [Kribbella sp. NPDC050124]|uniref:hypothetical protein n=1 Tax=Kribbella sp. NPDC050124 TaxID=3364114 RepID=UPI0037976F11
MPDLKQELQVLADRRSAESSADFDTVLTTAAARRRRRTAGWSAVAAVVVAAAVVGAVVPWDRAENVAENPPSHPTGMTITPATARPGQIVALTFPEATPRGIAFQLAKPTEPDKVLYYLTSDWGDPVGHTPQWSRDAGWVDVGISGPGPDRVVVPEIAADGTYLLCTANAAEQVCGLLTVEG